MLAFSVLMALEAGLGLGMMVSRAGEKHLIFLLESALWTAGIVLGLFLLSCMRGDPFIQWYGLGPEAWAGLGLALQSLGYAMVEWAVTL